MKKKRENKKKKDTSDKVAGESPRENPLSLFVQAGGGPRRRKFVSWK